MGSWGGGTKGQSDVRELLISLSFDTDFAIVDKILKDEVCTDSLSTLPGTNHDHCYGYIKPLQASLQLTFVHSVHRNYCHLCLVPNLRKAHLASLRPNERCASVLRQLARC